MISSWSERSDRELEYLAVELARVDLRLRRAVDHWRRAGQDPSDVFRGLYVSDDQAGALLARPLAASWGDTVAPSPGDEATFQELVTRAEGEADRLLDAAQKSGWTPRLRSLRQTFHLNQFEFDAFLLCLAPDLDLRYERIFGFLQDDVTRKRPSVNLVLEMLVEPGPERIEAIGMFADEANMLRHQLIEKNRASDGDTEGLLSQSLAVDKTVAYWLLGRYRPHPDMNGQMTLLDPQPDPTDRLVAGKISESVIDAAGEGAVVSFHGPDVASQEAAARVLADKLARRLLKVDLRGLIGAGIPPRRAVELALRDARLVEGLAYLMGWESLANSEQDGSELDGGWLLRTVCEHPGPVVVGGRGRWRPRGAGRSRRVLEMAFPVPDYRRRRELWGHFFGQQEKGGGVDLMSLAGQFELTSGQIRDAVASAHDRAAERRGPVRIEDLSAASRRHSLPNLGQLARKIEPRFGWADIVLPADQLALLREIVDTVRGRPIVLDDWGVGRKLASSRGVTVLFAGPPGTGKTMGAEIIAGELGLDIYKIDLSTVVSKYIGETEKNLARVFEEAESSNAILFFDEADALFGKRSEVRDSHDRYANVEISYLLQQMEAYNGLTILATNLRANLDDAFTRRLQFSVDFPFPEEEYRVRIWRTLFPADVPRESDIDFATLARRFKLAGGNIRNVIVSAAYLAAADGGVVGMNHLLHGTRRELQKMGRLVGEEDLTS